jgi:hypothetical protein
MATRKSSLLRDKYLTSEGGPPIRPWCVCHDDRSISIVWGVLTIGIIPAEVVDALIGVHREGHDVPRLHWP